MFNEMISYTVTMARLNIYIYAKKNIKPLDIYQESALLDYHPLKTNITS